VFFKVLAAIVTADAFDRHMREQQYRAWLAQDELRKGGAAAPVTAPGSDATAPWRADRASAVSDRPT
jgi:hypothetical protein